MYYGGATGANTVISGDVVAVFGPSETEQTVTLDVTADKATYAGEYSDTVLFTISVASSV